MKLHSVKKLVKAESDLASELAPTQFAHSGGPQAQTIQLANELANHIEQAHGTIWLMYFRDALSILDVSKLLCLPLHIAMQQADDIKAEIRRWADIGR